MNAQTEQHQLAYSKTCKWGTGIAIVAVIATVVIIILCTTKKGGDSTPPGQPTTAGGHYTDSKGTGAASSWTVRNFVYNGLKLKDALLFNDTTWKTFFFNSLQNAKHPGRMFYLVWKIKKAELNNNVVKWKVVMNNKAYSSLGGNHADPKNFGSRIPSDNSPGIHVSGMAPALKRNGDVVMVSPGKGGWAPNDDRCMFIGPFMQHSSDGEKTKLWQTSADIAMQRLFGKLNRNRVMQYNGPGNSGVGNGVAKIDSHGHNEIEINTHGGGVPWLHVRIESNPEYHPESGKV